MNKPRKNKNFTLIEDLEDIEDIEDIEDVEETDKYDAKNNVNVEKFIRKSNNKNFPLNSGMNYNNTEYNPRLFKTDPIQHSPSEHIPSQQNHIYPSQYNRPYERHLNENDYYEPYENTKTPPTCVEISDHVKNCSVCSRLYQMDKTLYIIAIIVLAIICIILLKRIIDV